jgi:hypothetical protein
MLTFGTEKENLAVLKDYVEYLGKHHDNRQMRDDKPNGQALLVFCSDSARGHVIPEGSF